MMTLSLKYLAYGPKICYFETSLSHFGTFTKPACQSQQIHHKIIRAARQRRDSCQPATVPGRPACFSSSHHPTNAVGRLRTRVFSLAPPLHICSWMLLKQSVGSRSAVAGMRLLLLLRPPLHPPPRPSLCTNTNFLLLRTTLRLLCIPITLRGQRRAHAKLNINRGPLDVQSSFSDGQ